MTETLPISDLSLDEDVDKRGHKGPVRQCVITGERLDKTAMVRFVLSPDGVVVPDILEKLPGRGVWVRANRTVVDQAVARKAFSRGFKTKVDGQDGLTDLVEDLLSRRVLGLIGMAHKAGHLALGFDQVKSVAQGAVLAFRIEASDGSQDGRGKIRVLSKAIGHELGQRMAPVIGCFSMEELGTALGRERIVHAALKPGGFAKTLKVDVARLSGFRDLVPAAWPDKSHEKGQIKATEINHGPP